MRTLVAAILIAAVGLAHANTDDVVSTVSQHLPDPPEVYGVSPTLADEDVEALRDAFAAMERARVLDGNNEAHLAAYTKTAEALGHVDLAAKALRKLVKKTPDDAERWRKLGEMLAAQGDVQGAEAFEALQTARRLNPDDARTHYLLGELYHRQGVFDAAKEAYAAAGNLTVSRVAAATLKVYDGDMVGAEADLAALGRDAQPFDVQTRLWLREALRSWENTRQFVPDTVEAHSAYARLLYRAARLPEAVYAARHATTLAPEDHELWNFLGAMLNQLGQPDQAREAYEKSLAANPNQPALREALQGVPQPTGQGQGMLR
jgi:Flp pilus assembly protein TadD